jgi:hypothetical protein
MCVICRLDKKTQDKIIYEYSHGSTIRTLFGKYSDIFPSITNYPQFKTSFFHFLDFYSRKFLPPSPPSATKKLEEPEESSEQLKDNTPVSASDVEISNLVKKMKVAWIRKFRKMTPAQLQKEITFPSILAGEKMVLESQNAKVEQETLEKMMAQLFGPEIKSDQLTKKQGVVSGTYKPEQVKPVKQTNP